MTAINYLHTRQSERWRAVRELTLADPEEIRLWSWQRIGSSDPNRGPWFVVERPFVSRLRRAFHLP